MLLEMDNGNHGGGDGCFRRMSIPIPMWGMARILVLTVVWVPSIWLITVVLILATEESNGAGLGGGESGIGVLIGCSSSVKLAVWWTRILLELAGGAGLLIVAGLAVFPTGMKALRNWIMARAFRNWEDGRRIGSNILIDMLTMIVSMVVMIVSMVVMIVSMVVVVVVVMVTMLMRARELIVVTISDI